MGGQPVPNSLFVYAPNQGAPVFFVVAFAVSAVGHIYQCFHYNSWKLVGLHPLCAVLFTAGYALREYGSFNYLYSDKNLAVYIACQVCIYICPPLLELANYHVLGRIFSYVPHLAPLPPDKVLAVFGGLMALVETLNSLGVSLSANPSASHQSEQKIGGHLTVAALALQFAAIVSFVVMAAIFHSRCLARRNNIERKRTITTLTVTMYVSMALILVRCVYRLVEHSLGNTTVRLGDTEELDSLSVILRYEWFFYVFEATPMLLNSALWNVFHPGRHLPRDHHVHLSRDGTTEISGQDDSSRRSLLDMLVSLLTFGLSDLLRNRNKSDKGNHSTAHRSQDDGPMAAEINREKDKRFNGLSLLNIVGMLLTFGVFFRPQTTKDTNKRTDRQPFEELEDYSAPRREV